MKGETDDPWLITNKIPKTMSKNIKGNSQSFFETLKYRKNSFKIENIKIGSRNYYCSQIFPNKIVYL